MRLPFIFHGFLFVKVALSLQSPIEKTHVGSHIESLTGSYVGRHTGIRIDSHGNFGQGTHVGSRIGNPQRNLFRNLRDGLHDYTGSHMVSCTRFYMGSYIASCMVFTYGFPHGVL